MQRVILLDELGEQFGAVHEYHGLRTPVDAIRLLAINYPEFNKHLIESGKRGVGYKVIQSEAELTLDDMLLPFGSKDLIIAPVIGGSGDGWGQIITGVALVGLAVGTFGLGGLAGGGLIGGLGFKTAGLAGVKAAVALGGNIGIAMTLGGISQLLAESTISTTGGGASTVDSGPTSIVRGSDGKQSYAYTGAANSVGVGATIPVCFGKALIGSHIISADIDVEDTSDPVFVPGDSDPEDPDDPYGGGGGWIGDPDIEDTTVRGQKLRGDWDDTSGIESRRIEDRDILSGEYPRTHYLNSPADIALDSTDRYIGTRQLMPNNHDSRGMRGEWKPGDRYRTKYFIIS